MFFNLLQRLPIAKIPTWTTGMFRKYQDCSLTVLDESIVDSRLIEEVERLKGENEEPKSEK